MTQQELIRMTGRAVKLDASSRSWRDKWRQAGQTHTTQQAARMDGVAWIWLSLRRAWRESLAGGAAKRGERT